MNRNLPEEPPPFFGKWRTIYLAVVLYLAAIIGVMYVFTRAFNR